MRSAVHRFARVRIFPDLAQRGQGLYICECCDAPVHLVRGSTPHFAHDMYRARPDCDNYVWSEYRYSGRPPQDSATPDRESQELSYLAFVMSTDGPRLAVYLPPLAEGEPTSGALELISRHSRTIPLRHLTRGVRWTFPLHEGHWTIRASSEVDEGYLARLSLGRQSLELDRNLFSASTSTGRRIDPREAIVLGESLWWIGRSDVTASDPLLSDVVVEQHAIDEGWRIYHVTLPDTANADEFAAISQWLQRRLQPRRARVWVESPPPRQVLISGVAVYASADGPMIWCADQAVALQVQAKSGATLFEAEKAMRVALPSSLIGELSVKADGVNVGRVQILADKPAAASSVVLDTEDARGLNFLTLQQQIDAAAAAGAPRWTGRIRWSPAALRPHLTYKARQVSCTNIECEFVLAPADFINFDKLGRAGWSAPPIAQPLLGPRTSLPRAELFRWLASVGHLAFLGGGLRLHLPPGIQQQFPTLRRLASLAWPRELAAQVNTAARTLKGMQ